jgi:hypothetical protein
MMFASFHRPTEHTGMAVRLAITTFLELGEEVQEEVGLGASDWYDTGTPPSERVTTALPRSHRFKNYCPGDFSLASKQCEQII